jgi:Fic-DOC domain mobile mystery protein B
MVKFDYPEGSTPLADYSGLLRSEVHNQGDLNRFETENIAAAKKEFLEKNVGDPARWFNIETLKSIHKAMFGRVWAWAGDFRRTGTSIGIEPNRIPLELSEFCIEVSAWSHEAVKLTFLERAARIHHRLVFIHPFENGNGRFSRLVADRYLVAYKCPYPHWPSLQDNGKLRSTYIQSLKDADNGDYGSLIKLMNEWGARDPLLSELLTLPIYKKRLSGQQRLAIVEALLQLGCDDDVNEASTRARTPLHIAIYMNIQDVALVLIKHGANITLRDKSGYDPFELAINKEMFEVALAIYKAGYPYKREMPASSKIKHDMLYKFEMEYLK